MGAYVVSQLVKAMLKSRIQVDGSRVLVMGLTFKENCPDLRNSRVVDVIDELEGFGCKVDIHDPWADLEEARAEFNGRIVETPHPGLYDAAIIAVAHNEFRQMGIERITGFCKPRHVLFDLKCMFGPGEASLRL